MGIVKKIVAAAVISMLASSPVFAAPVRPAVVKLPGVAAPAPVAMGTRLGGRVAQKNQLLGAPLFLAFLGAVAVTVGTIVVVDNGSSSPQGS